MKRRMGSITTPANLYYYSQTATANVKEVNMLERRGEVYLVAYLAGLKDTSALVGSSSHVDIFLKCKSGEYDYEEEGSVLTDIETRFREYGRFLYDTDSNSNNLFLGVYEGDNLVRKGVISIMEWHPSYRYWYSFDALVNALFHDCDDDWNDEFMNSLDEEGLRRLYRSVYNYTKVPSTHIIHNAFRSIHDKSYNLALLQLRKYYSNAPLELASLAMVE